MDTENISQAKGSSKQKGVKKSKLAAETPKEATVAKKPIDSKEAIVPLNDLAAKLGLAPRRLRAILRVEYPRQEKGKKWEITESLAKKIEKDIKAKAETKTQQKAQDDKSKVGITAEAEPIEKPELSTKPEEPQELVYVKDQNEEPAN